MNRWTSCFLVIAMFLPALVSALPAVQEAKPASIEIEGYQPAKNLFLERGAKFTVIVHGVEASHLRVIYRPTSKVEALETVGQLVDGKILWTPTQAGLARVEAFVPEKNEKAEVILDAKGHPKGAALVSRVVSIKLGPGFPLGLVIMALAGAILFFGAFVSIRALLSD